MFCVDSLSKVGDFWSLSLSQVRFELCTLLPKFMKLYLYWLHLTKANVYIPLRGIKATEMTERKTNKQEFPIPALSQDSVDSNGLSRSACLHLKTPSNEEAF